MRARSKVTHFWVASSYLLRSSAFAASAPLWFSAITDSAMLMDDSSSAIRLNSIFSTDTDFSLKHVRVTQIVCNKRRLSAANETLRLFPRAERSVSGLLAASEHMPVDVIQVERSPTTALPCVPSRVFVAAATQRETVSPASTALGRSSAIRASGVACDSARSFLS